jgi:opacity protein-like surface antigen
MKKIVILAGLMLLVATSAFAAKGDMWFGVSGGMAQPTGDAGDVLKTGFGGTLFGSYGVAKSCAIGLEAGLLQFKGDGNDDLTFTVMPVTVFTTYAFPMSDAKQMPYIKAGLGLYNVKAKLDLPLGGYDESDTKFGFNVGAGYDYEMSPKFTLGALASYHMIQTEDESTNLIYFGAKLGFGMAK